MKKMKRIEAIIKGKKLTEKLFGLKQKKIRRALETASDNVEKQKEDASIAYDTIFARMADEDADYQSIISQMIQLKQVIISANATAEALAAIKADLETEVEVEETED